MKKIFSCIYLLTFFLETGLAQNTKHVFALGDTAFLLDNKPLKNVAAYNVYKKTGSGNYNLLNRVLSSQLFLFD